MTTPDWDSPSGRDFYCRPSLSQILLGSRFALLETVPKALLSANSAARL
eukprot:CAMPEP_0198329332 /NCGR_PEP_ID=MMETSP1450-20131203/16122_1 /TAXON_ID=753684 ORGANISM="Madagascaria erythrocladiodes, Strain CCMP3234" /NCGR_SAMPLE_ID=MMETSP1450 /ASSEMBLY_ACC=CAM_ASM_001115 /LENGTH=48 /DNA_ID= /DNA_START= /DNA_END= /DNA_ORIENTATION=